MSVSSIRYQSAKNRFNSKPLSTGLTVPSASTANSTKSVSYEGFNPDTGLQKFKTKSGDVIEADNNNQHTASKLNQKFMIYQNNVVG